MIQAVGVVVPAHNEEELLPSCLAAIRQAISRVHGPAVHLVVVADACTDRTAAQARRGGAVVREIQARCVGAARRAGMREVLRRTRHVAPGRVWLATTDADTLVPAEWLGRQLRYATAGWDAVAGTVTVSARPVRPVRHQMCALTSQGGPAAVSTLAVTPDPGQFCFAQATPDAMHLA